MSIHGEYLRVLEALIDRLRPMPEAQAQVWREELEGARLGGHPDLSHAATASLETLLRMASDPLAQRTEGLVDPHDRLAAHCEIILGRTNRIERLPGHAGGD